mmetsp:Transcript_16080/g.27403  ORF Transcript_16080/g.27403 Transcript_16080/m.27403 type:complete len:247 (+) Transcript_16080:124-864(+)
MRCVTVTVTRSPHGRLGGNSQHFPKEAARAILLPRRDLEHWPRLHGREDREAELQVGAFTNRRLPRRRVLLHRARLDKRRNELTARRGGERPRVLHHIRLEVEDEVGGGHVGLGGGGLVDGELVYVRLELDDLVSGAAGGRQGGAHRLLALEGLHVERPREVHELERPRDRALLAAQLVRRPYRLRLSLRLGVVIGTSELKHARDLAHARDLGGPRHEPFHVDAIRRGRCRGGSCGRGSFHVDVNQ